MARIALLSPDLLFGSKVEGALKVAGHSVSRFDDEARLREGISFCDLLVVDLTTDQIDGSGGGGVDARATARSAPCPRSGFYSHVEQETRKRAEAAGLSRVVPRSRMAREGAALVEGLLPPG